MEGFVAKHAEQVIGTLSGFDRLVFRGTLRMLAHRGGLMRYLSQAGVLMKEFGEHVQRLTGQLRDASPSHGGSGGRCCTWPHQPPQGGDCASDRLGRWDRTRGMCILTAVEPCLSYEVVRHRASRHIEIEPRHRKCLFLYHYQIHPKFGFMHARIQTWFPFAIQICLNGREWLAREMIPRAGLSAAGQLLHLAGTPHQAQRLMDRQVQSDWPDCRTASHAA